MRNRLVTFLIILLTISFHKIIYSQGLPSGFEMTNAFNQLELFTRPIQIAFLPDGRKLVIQQNGICYIINAAGNSREVFIDLTQKVLNDHDKGLLGIAIDPDFTENKWIYFLYQVDPDSNGDDSEPASWGRLERYQMSSINPDEADLSTRQILIGNSWADGIPYTAIDGSHSIGSIRFGADKTLLVSTGDGAEYSRVDPGGLTPSGFSVDRFPDSEDMGCFRPQSLYSLSGKILRIDKETGLGLPSNPFYDGDSTSTRSKVWCYGLRNPYRFIIKTDNGSINPEDGNPGTLFIGDVQWNRMEELNVSHSGGENFGWPFFEALLDLPDYQNLTSAYNGNTNVAFNANNPLNEENPAPYTDPVLYWAHPGVNEPSNPVGWIGNTALACAVYTGSAFPTEYHNNVFIVDHGQDWVRRLVLDAQDNIIDTIHFGKGGFLSQMVSLDADPFTGDFFVVRANIGRIEKISYPNGNYQPIINASINPSFGLAPLLVTGDATGTTDPDDDTTSLSFVWYWGDGDSSLTKVATHTYDSSDIYQVLLKVTDPQGAENFKLMQVVVGQISPPVANILQPSDSSFFSVGVNSFFIAEYDSGATYQWDYELSHNDNHTHHATTLFGDTVFFTPTVPTDHSNIGEKYHWIVILTATEGGLTSIDSINIFPKVNFTNIIINTSTDTPQVNVPYDILVSVSNAGEVPTGKSTCLLYKDDVLVDSIFFNGIDVNDDTTFVFSDTPEDSNDINLRVVVDNVNLIHETNENDNTTNKVIAVGFPVELTTFNGIYKDNSIELSWVTATEVGNFGFEVEKKNSNSENWKKIGFINGSGNSNSMKRYSFIDKDLHNSNAYKYRLKQIDTDGSYEYSKEIEIQRILPNVFSLNQNYPNPFNPETKIEFSIPTESHVKLEIYNILGDKIITLVNEKRNPGFYSEIFNGSDLASGVYFYTFQAGDYKSVKKLMLLK